MRPLGKPPREISERSLAAYLPKLVNDIEYDLTHIDLDNISGFLGNGLNTATNSIYLGSTLICYGHLEDSVGAVFPIRFKERPAIITNPPLTITANEGGFTVPTQTTFDYIAIGRRNM